MDITVEQVISAYMKLRAQKKAIEAEAEAKRIAKLKAIS